MKKGLLKLIAQAGGIALASVPLLTLAGVVVGGPTIAPRPYTSVGQFQQVFCTVINWLFTFFLLLAIVFILYAAYRYLTAAGDPEKVKAAGNVLIYAVVAIVVAVLARGIPLIVSTLIAGGIDFTTLPC